MDSYDWIETFRSIPVAEHPRIMMMCTNGIELAMDILFRLEEKRLLMRGRQAGIVDEARVFIVPYAHLEYIYLNRIFTEKDMVAMFGAPDNFNPVEPLAAAPDERKSSPELPDAGATQPLAQIELETLGPGQQFVMPGQTGAQPFASPKQAHTDAAAAAKQNLLDRIRSARAGASQTKAKN